MQTFWLTAYVLIWPILTLGVFAVLTRGVLKDVQQARRKGESLV